MTSFLPRRRTCRHCQGPIIYLHSDSGIAIGWVHEAGGSVWCEMRDSRQAAPA